MWARAALAGLAGRIGEKGRGIVVGDGRWLNLGAEKARVGEEGAGMYSTPTIGSRVTHSHWPCARCRARSYRFVIGTGMGIGGGSRGKGFVHLAARASGGVGDRCDGARVKAGLVEDSLVSLPCIVLCCAVARVWRIADPESTRERVDEWAWVRVKEESK
ncbi:predicted protein [Plenodomus lingam JN3]|uniref:Uncharacterized protein n=2 Tax=Leptosphaeria maculans TaxID=5022 RepID=E4ZH06_LEPMJ|nr:predicted protein [Plenodomus lingam JN3]CBX90576.1 predicted protein [Plenodomus lingam JN3]